MKNSRFALGAGLALVLALVSGCVTESTGPVTPATTEHPILRATVTGKIIDGCTMKAIEGAVISVGYDGGVASTTSDASGSFSFGNVPVSRYQVVNGGVVANDIYTVTASLVNYNKNQADSTKRYRDYYYQNAQLTYTSSVDSAALVGLIGSVNFMISELRATVAGKIVDQNMQPVSGAVVTMFDNSVNPGAVIAQARANSTGDYQFQNVDNGITVSLSAKSADGSLSGNLPGSLTIPCNLPTDSLRSHVVAERLMVTPADNVQPFVIATSPISNADVDPTNFKIVYTFSEPIKQTPYTRTDLGLGHGTILDDIHVIYNGLKKTATDVPIAAQWDPTFTQLQITPQGIVGSARYTFSFVTAASSGKLQDMAGNALINNTRLTGDFEVLNFTTNGASAVPAAPTLSRRLIPGLYTNLDFAGGTVNLEWTGDAAARSYNVYRQVGNGSMELLASNVTNLQYTDNTPALVAPFNPPGVRDPLGPQSVQYTVRGVSKDLVQGAASNAVTVSDAVKPQLSGAVRGAALATNLYPFTLSFSEPMSRVPAETITNYTFSNTGGVTYTIQRADYLGYSGGFYIVRLTVATDAAPVVGAVLTVGNNVVDLTGNSIDSAFNSQTF